MTELLHHCAAQGHQLQVLISSIQQTLVNHLGKEENCNNQQAFSLFIIFCGNPNISMGKISTKHQISLGEDMVVCVCVCVCVFHVCVVADHFIRHYSLLSSTLTALLSHVILNE